MTKYTKYDIISTFSVKLFRLTVISGTIFEKRDKGRRGDDEEYSYSVRKKALYLVFNRAMSASFSKSIKNIEVLENN